MLPAFTVQRPSTVTEAAALLSEDSVAYCGGTEILLAMRMGLLRPDALVDLKRVAELRDIRREGDELVIGATATHDEVADSAEVATHAPLLVEVERHVGNARVRAQGSIGGNLCFAEPRSDLAAVLVAMDASLTLASPTGTRRVAMGDFALGPYWTSRQDDELLVSVSVPLPAPSGAYVKMQTSERPTVGVAVVRHPSDQSCRVVVGAVTEKPLLFTYADEGSVDPDAIADSIEPVADLSGSVSYKRHVTAVYVRRALAALQAGAAHDE